VYIESTSPYIGLSRSYIVFNWTAIVPEVFFKGCSADKSIHVDYSVGNFPRSIKVKPEDFNTPKYVTMDRYLPTGQISVQALSGKNVEYECTFHSPYESSKESKLILLFFDLFSLNYFSYPGARFAKVHWHLCWRKIIIISK